MKDFLNYAGKVCVVTGAASGMGKATAEMLVELGAKVYALDWAEVNVEGITQYIHTDLSQKESIDAAFTMIPEHIDSFFGIAGISGSKHDFLTTVKVDLIANKYISEEYLVNRMTKGGSVAYMTSTGGNGWENEDNKKYYKDICEATGWDDAVAKVQASPFAMCPGTLGYPFSKLAMNYYTVHVQKTLTAKGIRVNSVLPGSTITGMVDEFEAMAGGMDNLLSHTGYAGRLANSEEMAAPIVFINSDMASYMSGETMIVDFGHSAEIRAGIKTDAQPVNLSGILQYMMQMAQKQ